MSKQRSPKESRELPSPVNSVDWEAYVRAAIERGTFRTIHLDRSISSTPAGRR